MKASIKATLLASSGILSGAAMFIAAPSITFAAGPAASSTPSSSASPEIRDYREILDLYNKRDYEGALLKIKGFEAKYPQSAQMHQIENLRGLSFLLTKRPDEAVLAFQRAIQKNTRNPAFNQFLLYNQAKAEFEAGRVDQAQQTLDRIKIDGFDADNKVKYHVLKSNVLRRKKLAFEAARELLAAGRIIQEAQLTDHQKSFDSNLEQLLQELTEAGPLQDLYQENENAPFADQILFALASREATSGKSEDSQAHFRLLVAKFPSSPLAASARERIQGPKQNYPLDPTAVGVLLPTKGKFAKFGNRSLQAIELALGVFGPSDSADSGALTVVIEDSGDDPDQAVQALNRLVSKFHVSAVIGPLLSKGVDQVTKRADELGVPLISLARNQGTGGEQVLQGGLTMRLQAYEAARHAVEKGGMKRFAIVAPKDKGGEETSQYFWDAVESLGGTITGIEFYNPGETDFKHVVDKLSGLYYTEARQDELNELAELRRANNIKKRTRKTEQYFSLKPIVDYEAVFIADDPRVASQIMPTFAYRDVDQVKFLGTSTWNTPELFERAPQSADKAIFVDAFATENPNAAVQKFLDSYKATFGEPPSSMEAMAFDAAKVLERALLSGGKISSRLELLDRLKETRGYVGVSGRITQKDGQLLRDLKALTFTKAGKIIELP